MKSGTRAPQSDTPKPANPAQEPDAQEDAKTPRKIPREQMDHQAPGDPDPDDPASP